MKENIKLVYFYIYSAKQKNQIDTGRVLDWLDSAGDAYR